MKNKEKYNNEIMKIIITGQQMAFDVTKNTVTTCWNTDCDQCLFGGDWDCDCDCNDEFNSRREWLEAEYVEPEIDWSKVPVNTPILVKDYQDQNWYKRYFCKYENNTIYAWSNGKTSWTTQDVVQWDNAELQEVDSVDWTKIPVDTPILVRDYDSEPWTKCHFCKYENDTVYAWCVGNTSRTVVNPNDAMSSSSWKQAKLAF